MATSGSTFSRALKHLKESPSTLSEQPTNNTSGLYQVEPDTFVQTTVNADVDLPDFGVGESPTSTVEARDTSGLFMPDGTIKVIEPPGDTSFILGPMASMWYAWGNFSTFGYIRQSDRKMVNLGRITGRLGSWDGVSNFTSYGQFTIEQARWFRDTPKLNGADNDTPNYRAYYPGPPSNTPDQYGRYYCVITGTPKQRTESQGKKGDKVDPKKAGFPWGDKLPSGLKKSGEEKRKKGKPLTIDDFNSAADFSAFKAGGGNAALSDGKSLSDVIDQGKKNLGTYDSGPKISDPYKLTSQEKDILNNIAQTKGPTAARDAQVAIEIDKLQKLDSIGKLSPRQKIDLIALQANQGYASLARGADAASDVLNTIMLAKGGADLAKKGIQAGIGAAVKAAAPKGLSSAGLKVGATGVNKAGFDALTKGQPFQPSSKPQILGQGAYSAPKVGTTGGVGGGSGAARYAGSQGSLGGGQQPGGVVGSLTPKGSARIPIIEPQSKVPATTFDKGARIVRDVQSGKYPNSPKAQQIQQQLGQAGFPKGQSSIPYDQLPKGASAASQIGRAAATAGTLGALSQIQGSTPQSGPGSNASRMQQAISNPSTQTLGATNFAAFKAGGGQAALSQQGNSPEALSRIIAQGKQNISAYSSTPSSQRTSSNSGTATAAVATGALVGGYKINPSWNTQQAANAASNVKTDYKSIIQNPKVGLGKNYDFSDWQPSREGLKANLLKDGKPVMGTDGKPLYVTASGVDKDGTFTTHGKGQQTTGNNLRKIINQVKSTTPAVQTGSVSVTQVKKPSMGAAEKAKYVDFKSGSGPKPVTGNPSTFKALSQAAGKIGKSIKFSYEPQGQLISDSYMRIIRDIKKPVIIPEEKQEKIKRRPRIIGAEPRTINSDLMKQAEVPTSFKPAEERLWGKYEKEQNARASQDRKNVVLDYLGNADQAWDYLIDRNANKRQFSGYFEKDGTPRTIFKDGKVHTVTREEVVGNDTLLFLSTDDGNKESILQSELNDFLDQSHTQQLFHMYDEHMKELEDEQNEKLFDRISQELNLKKEQEKVLENKTAEDRKIASLLSGFRLTNHLRKINVEKTDRRVTSWADSFDRKIAERIIDEGMTTSSLTVQVEVDPEEFGDPSVINTGSQDNFQEFIRGMNFEGSAMTVSAVGITPYAFLNPVDTRYSDTVTVTGGAASASVPAGIAPQSDLILFWYNVDTDQFGEMVAIPKNSTSISANYITLPPEARGANVEFAFFLDRTFEQVQQSFIGKPVYIGNQKTPVQSKYSTSIANSIVSLLVNYGNPATTNADLGLNIMFYASKNPSRISGYEDTMQDPWYPGIPGPVSGNVGDPKIDGYNSDLYYLKNNSTFQSVAFMYGYFGANTQQQMADLFYDTTFNGAQFYLDLKEWDRLTDLRDGFYTQYISYSDAGNTTLANYYLNLSNQNGTLATNIENAIHASINAAQTLPDSEWTDEDFAKVAEDMYNIYGKASSYAVTNFSTRRFTPLSVFVPLDSPEAVSFMRTDPIFTGLTPQERLAKLKKMLEAGDEYVLKALGVGFPGSPSAQPYEIDPQVYDPTMYGDNYGEIASLPSLPAGPSGFDRKPGSYHPNNIIPIRTPGSSYRDGEGFDIINPFQNSPQTGPGLSQGGDQDTQIAQQWTDDPSTWPSIKNPTKTAPAIIDPKTGWPSVPNVPPSYRGKPSGQPVRLAHYEPQGEIISETKYLKSPKDILG